MGKYIKDAEQVRTMGISGIRLYYQMSRQMTFRYLLFRSWYEFEKRAGLLKYRFPQKNPRANFISLSEWRKKSGTFFFESRKEISFENYYPDKNRLNKILAGEIQFFYNQWIHLDANDWTTNPLTGNKYDPDRHWSLIKEFSARDGDIKYVWEKSRFCYLYDIIRFDQAYQEDHSKFVFSEIESWIIHNPVNSGPNWICSQEISLRVLNWTFALFYYKNSDNLTDELFRTIINSIHHQIQHVYKNIRFSLIAVRNNHALTETLGIFLAGLLFPFFPESNKWKIRGKSWFEKEIAYQIYSDGTYLQFSNNYHRVVAQLLTWGIRLADLNGEKFNDTVYDRAGKSLEFLFHSMDSVSGQLPNYGSNDGALFFKLNNQDFRDFRPQLQALAYVLKKENEYCFSGPVSEDILWLGYSASKSGLETNTAGQSQYSYRQGGFYIFCEHETRTFIRCGNHKDRPAHADNLHLDIWHNGINYFRDSGSFMYNTKPDLIKYFTGTRSHNTVMIDNFDQMLKGSRFIWYYWSQAEKAEVSEQGDRLEFEGVIRAFSHVDRRIRHQRKVTKIKGSPKWIVDDFVFTPVPVEIHQLWHVNPDVKDFIKINARDAGGNDLEMFVDDGYYSSNYGMIEVAEFWRFSSKFSRIITEIEITG